MHCVAFVENGGKEAPLPAPEAILRHPSIMLIIYFLPAISHSSPILFFSVDLIQISNGQRDL